MDAQAYRREAESLLKQDRGEEAVALLTKAIDEWPSSEELVSTRAYAFALAGDHRAAIEDLNTALSLAPIPEPCLLFDRGRYHHLSGQLKEAESDFKRLIAIELDAGDTYYSDMARFFLAAVLLDQGSATEASTVLQQVPRDMRTYHGQFGLMTFTTLETRAGRMKSAG
ncbi:MAG: hypothetical protein JSS45_13900 [Proteobacteria bacterium]|nr:hypothetical protein [Pseudomonadota bacterium]